MIAKLRVLALALTVVPFAVGRSQQVATAAPSPDPRVGLTAGWMNAGQAAWNLQLVSTSAPPAQFTDPARPGDIDHANSDLAFTGNYVVQGNFNGIEVWDISTPGHPTAVTTFVCPGEQNDVSVYRNLLFVSVESLSGRVDCGAQGVTDSVSAQRMRGIRIFDIGDIAHPKLVINVQTCRGSHTHTLVTDPFDTSDVFVYVSGSAPVRSPHELAGCSDLSPDRDSTSELFKIEVIQVPLRHPEDARVISKPAILGGLHQAPSHGETSADVAAAKRAADSARAAGGFVVTMFGLEHAVRPGFIASQLDSIVKARGGSGAPTGADSTALRGALQGIVDRLLSPPAGPGGVRPGPEQCHDITVYPAMGVAGGACAGYGLLLDISSPAHPRRVAAVSDSNFSFWHSATFSNDGSKVLFTDEWGGGLQPRCRATDPMNWGADAIFTIADSTLKFAGYYKMPAPQTAMENCVAHNGSLIPVPGRDIMVQGWYQGGVSVFDWTDPAHVQEIAFFDRGPMDSTRLELSGSWSAYWYNGQIVSSEIGRGLDIFDLQPSPLLSPNEIDAAKLVHFDVLNVQDQPRFSWPTSYVVARAYVDQLERSGGLSAARVAAVRTALDRAEQAAAPARRIALNQLAAALEVDAATSHDADKVRTLESEVQDLATAH